MKNKAKQPGYSPNEAVNAISSAASEAVKVIADAASEASKVVAQNALNAAKVVDAKNSGDHDTLITLVNAVANLDKTFTEKFLEIKADIKGILDGTTNHIDDHEARIRVLEKESEDHVLVKKVVYGAVSFVLLTVLSSIVYLVVKH